jgi:AcrR family transcriptional regulator
MTPPPTVSESSAETRRRMVFAARDRFLASGFSSVTMDDIARELGMSKKTLYEFFPGKMDLLRATMRLKNQDCEQAFATYAAENLEFFARARKIFGYIAQMYARITPAYMTDVRRNAPAVWSEMQEFKRTRVRRYMLDLLDQGVKQGVLRRDLDRETLVRLYLTMTSALVYPEISNWEAGEPIAPIFETFIRVYFEGLITPAGRRRRAAKPHKDR